MAPSVRLYVSGASRELVRAKAAIARIHAEGFEVTHDWTADVEAHPAGDASLTRRERTAIADADLAGVDAADLVLWLVADEPSWGAPFEVGYAVAKGKIVVAVGMRNRTPFGARCVELDTSDAEALDIIFAPAAHDERAVA